MRIPIAQPMLGEEEIEATARVIRSGMLSGGPETTQFEREFAAYLDVRHFVSLTSGTTALEAILEAMPRVEGKDEIIVPAFTFDATISAVFNTGYRPVFVDVEHDSHNINLAGALQHVNTRTRAMIVVHLFGQMVDMDRARAVGVDIIEDAAQAHGSSQDDRHPGYASLGATFSFYATKNMTTGGEGGGVATNSDELNMRLLLLREHGSLGKYNHVTTGHNWRMTEMQAAIGREQLKKLGQWQRDRYANAMYYQQRFSETYGIGLPNIDLNHGIHQYVIQTTRHEREKMTVALRAKGIGYDIHYPRAAPLQPYIGYRPFSFPVAEMAANGCLSLPVGPWMTFDDLREVADTVVEALK